MAAFAVDHFPKHCDSFVYVVDFDNVIHAILFRISDCVSHAPIIYSIGIFVKGNPVKFKRFNKIIKIVISAYVTRVYVAGRGRRPKPLPPKDLRRCFCVS